MLNFKILLTILLIWKVVLFKIITANVVTVENGELPFVVVIKYTDERGFACTGSIIKSDWILTSAACVYGENTEDIEVQYDKIKFAENEPKNAQISKIFAHKNYEYNKFFNDIALIRVKNSIEFNQFTRPINLPTEKLVLSENRLAFVGAWTGSNISEVESGRILKKIDSITLSNEGNGMVFHLLQAAVIFANTSLSDSLIEKGRTGSPLILDEQQIGIYVSELSNDAKNGDTHVYTDVSFYRNWIDEIVNSN